MNHDAARSLLALKKRDIDIQNQTETATTSVLWPFTDGFITARSALSVQHTYAKEIILSNSPALKTRRVERADHSRFHRSRGPQLRLEENVQHCTKVVHPPKTW